MYLTTQTISLDAKRYYLNLVLATRQPPGNKILLSTILSRALCKLRSDNL